MMSPLTSMLKWKVFKPRVLVRVSMMSAMSAALAAVPAPPLSDGVLCADGAVVFVAAGAAVLVGGTGVGLGGMGVLVAFSGPHAASIPSSIVLKTSRETSFAFNRTFLLAEW